MDRAPLTNLNCRRHLVPFANILLIHRRAILYANGKTHAPRYVVPFRLHCTSLRPACLILRSNVAAGGYISFFTRPSAFTGMALCALNALPG